MHACIAVTVLLTFFMPDITYHSSNSISWTPKTQSRYKELFVLFCFFQIKGKHRIMNSTNISRVLHEEHRICIVKQFIHTVIEGNSEKEGKPCGRPMVRSACSAYVKRAGIGWLPTPFPFRCEAILSEDLLDWCIGHARTLTPVGSVEIRSAYLRPTVTLLQGHKCW